MPSPIREKCLAVPNENDSSVSKSQRKRKALALQSLADEMVQLSAAELDTVPVSGELREAVVATRALTRSAYRRQIRYLGRLLRDIDVTPIRKAVDTLKAASHEDKARLRRLERWRERLLEEGDAAVKELVEIHPSADRQQLRQLVRNARREREEGRPPRTYRQLFRFLKDL
jgi:ribosome-associated protein